jgi:hypothetical protein
MTRLCLGLVLCGVVAGVTAAWGPTRERDRNGSVKTRAEWKSLLVGKSDAEALGILGPAERVRRLSDGTTVYDWPGRSRDREGCLDPELVLLVRPDGLVGAVNFTDAPDSSGR